ncbi:hypothetical protein WDU94_005619 [Cyamophila willieti]
MEIQVNGLEQKNFNNKIEISGIKDKAVEKDEVTRKILNKMDSKAAEIQFKTEKLTREGENGKTSIVVEFRTQEVRNMVLTKIKEKRLYSQLGDVFPNNGSNIYINEALCPYYKKLLYQANNIKRDKKYAFLWVKDGKILLKKAENGKTMRLDCLDDLVLHINIRSIRLYWDLLCIKIKNVLSQLDLLILTEINVKEEEALSYQLRSFTQLNKCRIRRSGGGVIVFYRDCIHIEYLEYNFDEAENINIKLTHLDTKFKCTVLVIYRPPKNNRERFLNDLNFWLQNGVKKDENLIMIGDINICTLKRNSNNTRYLNVLNNSTLVPTIIKKPTREEMVEGSPTTSCIDHINVRINNKNQYDAISSVIPDKLADHYFITLRVTKRVNEPIRSKSPELIDIIDNRIVDSKILATNWEELKKIDNPTELHNKVILQFNEIYESATKKVQKKDNVRYMPWVNNRIKQEINTKKILLQRWRNNKNNRLLYEHYKKQRNVVTNLIKKEKRIYMYKLFQEASGDMLKTWSLINDMLDRKVKEPLELKLQRNFQTQDSKLLANNFNVNFMSQIKDIKNKNTGPVLDVQTTEHEPHSVTSTMYLRKVEENDVYKILRNMKKRGRGIDGLRNCDIIRNINILTPIITHLVNLMIRNAKIPNVLKTSCITPLFKNKGKPDVLGSYRPVGSMPIIEKVLEKHMNTQTKKYLDENDIIPDFQHGFQSGKSTMTLLQDFADQINTALDQRKAVVVLLLDLSFAFDTINHERLMKKFNDIGMTHPIWKNYFEERKQVTRVGSIISPEIPVEQGLVQGAVNSPTWYNVYTYDVKYVQRTGSLKMFADDSCIISIHHDVRTAVANAQQDFINLQKYLYNNQIFLNEKKTEALVLGFQSKRIDMNEHKLYCHSRQCLYDKTYESSCTCHQIDYKPDAKYLGVHIDSEFRMKTHVINLSKKLRILRFKLNKVNADKLPMTTKRTIYFSLVDSLLRYGVTLYMYSTNHVLNPLYNLQKKILSFLFKDINVHSLNPEQLNKYVLLSTNFFNKRYRILNPQPYDLRVQRFRRARVYTVQYGDRRLDYLIPSLLNIYCHDFLNEEKIFQVKEKIKQRLLTY